MPDEPQVQAPQETLKTRPSTTDPAWLLLFDRLDHQDENIKRAVDNTVALDAKFETLRGHVNDEQEKFTQLLETTVRKGEVIADLVNNVRHNRVAQAIVVAIVVAMAPVVVANWTALLESLRRFV